jgi:preprotein translocase subunit SecA
MFPRDFEYVMVDGRLTRVVALKPLKPTVAAINAVEPSVAKLSDEELKSRTATLRLRVVTGQKSG